MEDPIASSNLATAGKPSQTIYVNNLNEKIKLPKLKQTLASTFRPLGNVLEVIALSNVRTPLPLLHYFHICTLPPPSPPASYHDTDICRFELEAKRLLSWKRKIKPSPP